MINLARTCNDSCLLDNEKENLINLTISHAEQSPPQSKNDSICEETNLNNTLEQMNFLLKDVEELPTNVQKSVSKIPIKGAPHKIPVNASPYFKKPVTTTVKTISTKKIKHFDHIISPVATLINKTANSPLVQKKKCLIGNKILPKTECQMDSNKKQQIISLPPARYKPPTRREILVKEDKIPKSMEKHLKKPMEVTKHDKFVILSSTLDITDEANLTENTFNHSILNGDSHMSFVVTNKKF